MKRRDFLKVAGLAPLAVAAGVEAKADGLEPTCYLDYSEQARHHPDFPLWFSQSTAGRTVIRTERIDLQHAWRVHLHDPALRIHECGVRHSLGFIASDGPHLTGKR